MKLLLASKSPRRRALLKRMGLDFGVKISSVHEKTALKRPAAIVRSLALRKARDVAAKFPKVPVIGADTIVVCKGRILGKPRNIADARRILRLQNGSWQKVYTGVAVIWKERGTELADYEVSRCKARKLSEAALNKLSSKHHDKAGAYAVQDKNDPFVEKITGPVDNVVGLPCALLARMLKKAGVKCRTSKRYASSK